MNLRILHSFKISICLSLLISIPSFVKAQIYKSAKAPIEQRIDNLMKLMTLEEKIAQLSGIGTDTKANTRLGIPGFRMADGPVGVRNGKATAFPCGIALGASWDTLLIHNIATAMAKEVKAKKLNTLLGPCVNIHRFPFGGRNFESFGEDPYLSSRLTVNYIKGLQGQKVIASVKHFACNDQEWNRMTYNVNVDERALNEIHFPMFKAAVKEAGVWTVMSAYNKVNGPYASASKYLINDVLKKDWGFKGVLMSDWEATHSTVASALGGLDLEMPTGIYFGDSLLTAVKQKKVSEEIINDKVRRILRVKFLAGLFDPKITKIDTMVIYSKEHKQLALDAARASMVLLKNKDNILPLDKTKIKSIAIIGPNSIVARTGGGGSSIVSPLSAISPLEAIKKKVGKTVKVNYALGDQLDIEGKKPIDSKYLVPANGDGKDSGLYGEYYTSTNLEGTPVVTRVDKQIDFDFELKPPAPKIGEDNWSSRWTGMIKPPVSRSYTIFTQTDDGVRVWFDNKLVIENWDVHGPELDSFIVELEAGKSYPIKIEYFEGNMGAMVKLAWDLPESGKTNIDRIAEAVEAAKQSEVAIVFAGFSHQYERESIDRMNGMNLPNKQNELILAVAKANPKTIVVLNNGAPVNVSQWLETVPGLLEAWYSGQATADAVADILFGDFNPSGKLPISYIVNEDQSPAMKGYKNPDLNVNYEEGIFVGYRYYDKNNIQPAFAFGYGLSYTQFEYSNLKVTPLPNGTAEISLEVKNIGKRAGAEVVQLYIKDVESKLPRPEKELKGFSKVQLEPGAKAAVNFVLSKDAMSYYDPKVKKWVMEPGVFDVMVGSSSRDIKLKNSYFSK